MNIREERRTTFRAVGQRLLLELTELASAKTDPGLQGTSAEEAVRTWLSRQLPGRFRVFQGAVLSSNNPPTTQRDGIVFDSAECPHFRQIGDEPDLFPIEGVIGAVEINTGRSGSTYSKLIADCAKLTEVGVLYRDAQRPPGRVTHFAQPAGLPSTVATLQGEFFATQTVPRMSPFLYLFVENLRGSLEELAKRVAAYNLSVSVSASVSGVFVLGKGFILHFSAGEGWNLARYAGFPLGFVEAEPWEVVLKFMTMIWNQIYKVVPSSADIGGYYADRRYFLEVESPRLYQVTGPDYEAQIEEGLATSRI